MPNNNKLSPRAVVMLALFSAVLMTAVAGITAVLFGYLVAAGAYIVTAALCAAALCWLTT